MASEAPGHTLQATALVHEAWIRLVDEEGRVNFQNRAHFFCAAAEAMRRILVDRARAKSRSKRGNGAEHIALDNIEVCAPTEKSEELLLVDEALEKLAAFDARKAEVVKLHYFAGFTFEETSHFWEYQWSLLIAIGLLRGPGCMRRSLAAKVSCEERRILSNG